MDLHEAWNQLYVDVVAVPAVSYVLRVALSATLQAHTVALGHSRVARCRHEIDVACATELPEIFAKTFAQG